MKSLIFDIGGSSIKYAVSDGSLSGRGSMSTPQSYKEMLRSIRSVLYAESGIGAVCCAIPGVYDKEKRLVLFTPNIPYLSGKSLADDLGFDIPVIIENDANMAALGEYHHGLNKADGSLLLLTLGTGVGGGIVSDGKLFTGNITSFEPGHMTLVMEGRACGCGRKGCFERYCTTGGIAMSYEEAGGKAGSSVGKIASLAHTGDKPALAAFDAFAMGLAHGVSGLINIFMPRHVRIGGGLSELTDLYFERMLSLTSDMIFPAFRGQTEIAPATLKNDAALLGGAHLL
jgi:glucokinase